MSYRKHSSQSEPDHNNDDNTSNNPSNTSNTSNNTHDTELPQPAITRTHQFHRNSSIIQMLDKIPPPSYYTVSSTTPLHSRDQITISVESLPEYDDSTITTQPQARSHPSRNHRSSSDPLLSSKSCKICQESETNDKDIGKLISPCKCKGSLQYVHIGCLNRWRHSNVRAEASYRCEVCKYEYKFYRPRIARIFSSCITVHFLTLVLLLSSIYILSCVIKLFDTPKVINDPTDPSPYPTLPTYSSPTSHKIFDGEYEYKWRQFKDTRFLNLRLIHLMWGTGIISIFGLIFFIWKSCFDGVKSTRDSYCHCSGYNQPIYIGGGGDCSGGDGDCGAFIILALLLILAVIFLFGLIGAVIASYLLTQKIISIFLKKVHDRILEVNKD